eukprot:PhF_6_TR5119/c0_g1_i1/m.7254/K02736/PSMB4; 20S proteasome subunit beta 7
MASGGSVIAVKYNGGVVMASDTLLSYGSLAKVPNVPRSVIIGKRTAVCANGDYADFQNIVDSLEGVYRDLQLDRDGDQLGPTQVFTYLQRVLYQKRSDMEPALCTFVVVGWNKGANQPFLGVIDDIGTHWTADYAGTVFGQHMAVPLLRAQVEEKGLPKTRDDAIVLLEQCMRVLFYRECRTINRIQVVDASPAGVVISDPYVLDTNWEYEGFHFNKTAIIE